MIKEIDFDTILPIWTNNLWPNRISAIETHSAMIYMSGKYDIDNFLFPVVYFGYYDNEHLVGVNSVHICSDNLARSRGLWVEPISRKKGVGKSLLERSINFAREYEVFGIWSFPRKSSWKTYNSVGFVLTSEWLCSETSDANAYCYLGIK